MTDYTELVKALREQRGWALNETLDAAADAIEELKRDLDFAIRAEAAAVKECTPRWISVEERLPEKYHQVLVYGKNGFQIDYYAGAQSVCGNPLFMVSEAKATHWMPLPEPPKEETE